ncbi:MAG: SRPBCC family protein [Dehalococcoidia bacterium]|nr:SRPBCC family protein [Dehalococcoidia bacterium]
MAQMRMEILIAAPVDKVYDFVANVENHPRYADFVERLDITSPYRLGLGVTFNQYLHLGGETVAVPSQVIELVPLQKVVWTSPHRGYVMPVTYLFESTGQGTRVTHMAEAPWYDDPGEQSGWLEDNRRELENLKRLLEQAG